MKNCLECETPIPESRGRGRPRKYCNECRPPRIDTRRRRNPPAEDKTCLECGVSIGGNRTYCSKQHQNRYKWRKRARSIGKKKCAICGVRVQSTKAEPTCRPCRKAISTRNRVCVDCGTGVAPSSLRCRPCQAIAQRVRPDEDYRVKRRHREQSAPGLTRYQREQLLARWKKQGRTCAYCASPVETIDHALPLVRGGTNHEGNLAPCCRSCNSRKAGKMIIEWRTGRRCGPGPAVPWDIIVATPKPAKPKRTKQTQLNFCAICGEPHSGPRRRYCSQECMVEGNARLNRERYRASVGLPPTATTPTRPRVERNPAA